MRILILLTLALAGVAQAAKNPCKLACTTAQRACVVPFQLAFIATKAACHVLPTGAERKPCLAAARLTRATGKASCKTVKHTCVAGCGSGNGTPQGGCGSHEADWLATVNLYRGLGGLAPVTERAEWSAGDLAHATYTAKEDVIGHTENPSSPNYTAEGATAAANGNVAANSSPMQGYGWAIDLWMTGPFHAIGIIDPRLAESGFGIAHDSSGSIQTGAVLDVLRGRTASTAGLAFPLIYPGDGKALPFDRYAGNEAPDPLTPCAGYTQPTGPPLIVQFDASAPVPALGPSSLTRDGVALEHCVYDGTSYTNPDPGIQASARSTLAGRAAVVIIPKAVLTAGATYRMELTAGGQPLDWSFSVDCR
jgi:uncharacterized protein YkwD